MKILAGLIFLFLFGYLISQSLNVTQEVASTSEGRESIIEIAIQIGIIWIVVFGAVGIVKVIKLRKQINAQNKNAKEVVEEESK